MKEPLGFSEESEYLEDRAAYLLGKIIVDRLTIPYLIEILSHIDISGIEVKRDQD